MTIIEVIKNKKQFLSLLLLADEQENMIDRYLERGTMYVLNDNGVKAECVVTDECNGILEIKNIATVPEYQGKGYANRFNERGEINRCCGRPDYQGRDCPKEKIQGYRKGTLRRCEITKDSLRLFFLSSVLLRLCGWHFS